ncbi:MAG: GTP cyclohydrolase I FolE [Candidatus Omnitrophica bacterium]|nr:GTP cyclohydrolase I FolE [Candidatus Omnitrophota bacterium]MCM8809011.1 GTP cyclohydrolase I FolE [Candidatus Omnitrophota bacterium]MCM8811161.1 GTP cyclohydrolase I FolE [Candidatus Omnitrophota bacterium]MCM8833642.1 GTP cyclohydrolase I FolE [Candidatus Omnitrophota bacterium]
MKMDIMKIEKGMKLIIEGLGENINKKNLKDTPKRVAKMYVEIFSGIDIDPKKVLGKVFKEDYNELVLIKDINFYSICEHHFLPFFGKAHIAYLPDGNNVVGISKIARLVDVLSKRPQLQERMTNQIVDIIMNVLTPQGAMAIVEAEHMCMIMRGIKKPGTKIVTSAMRGIFLRDLRTRTEALNLISPSKSI